MKRIRVLIADDHPIFLEGLKTFISLEDPGIEIVATATNGREAVEGERLHQPDVVLMDIKMPVMDGIAAALAMRARRPGVKIIMLTTFDDRELIANAIRAGAKGYLLKDARADEVVRAIRTVHEGNMLILDVAADKLFQRTENAAGGRDARPEVDGRGPAKPAGARSAPLPAEFCALTEREREILSLIARGFSDAEIGEELFISEKTVRNYVSHIYEILDAPSRAHAIRWAIEKGIHVVHRS